MRAMPPGLVHFSDSGAQRPDPTCTYSRPLVCPSTRLSWLYARPTCPAFVGGGQSATALVLLSLPALSGSLESVVVRVRRDHVGHHVGALGTGRLVRIGFLGRLVRERVAVRV